MTEFWIATTYRRSGITRAQRLVSPANGTPTSPMKHLRRQGEVGWLASGRWHNCYESREVAEAHAYAANLLAHEEAKRLERKFAAQALRIHKHMDTPSGAQHDMLCLLPDPKA